MHLIPCRPVNSHGHTRLEGEGQRNLPPSRSGHGAPGLVRPTYNLGTCFRALYWSPPSIRLIRSPRKRKIETGCCMGQQYCHQDGKPRRDILCCACNTELHKMWKISTTPG
ncbi:hypothetical protein VFPPC_17677 [Pochonia chlamydosporia 170]|uniref:Uncharacterized protein n=1 Tax=Pochonia chlamydosporia 170 TaxID=1380566 RepID=A0A219AQU4_METCM|nr:hypothetical protein VFPPC_17677 [Pochonia chlamydosporia 170]OWT43147.1 hypothetical protein VFPPC_17677 [Pochonia chlamydosporia 170]